MRAPETGSEIDGFRLGELLHVGTMASIYRLVGPKGPLPLIMKIPRLGAGERSANVVSFDLSDEQLSRDREVADREGLALECVRGDMADLSALSSASFDLIFHPVSNVFVSDVRPVWRECFRVLRPGGQLLAGFMNPSFFLFDHDEAERTGMLVVKHRLPYSVRRTADLRPTEFSHSLEDQIGGQIAAGFSVVGLYEDHWLDGTSPLNRFSPVAIATRAVKGDVEQPAAADGDR